ncbi:DUF1129 domain-containing protein [Nicoliella spurrieriana]|uniref:DUF1129 domain-containing protein n=1 Tax=Nicoliella spurrieriana TaxID=2925830 RepID=A0A976RT29_9LACO|nr:DUF1129 domain-containing protein [Nicoliella spurrieriana]UQS87096.1 DUF1129 domain-containing protein [Nicoliella spurrieriana]
MSNENRKRNAAAAAQQKKAAAKVEERNAFDNMGLTKRNAEYMFRFKQQLDQLNMLAEKKREVVDSMVNELVQNQKSGATARNLYGTVEQRIDFIKNPPREKEAMFDNYWPNAIYNFFIFLAIFFVAYGASVMFSKDITAQQAKSAGVAVILITSLATGALMPIFTRMFDPAVKHQSKWYVRLALMLLLAAAWIIVSFGAIVVVPTAINPVLPGIADIIIAVISFGITLWMRRKFKITTGLFVSRRQPRK